MKTKPYLILSSIVLFFLAVSCANDNEEALLNVANCDTETVSYTVTVAPILENNCAISGCHNAAVQSAGYNFSTYEGVVEGVDRGRFLGSIRHDSGFSPMPKAGTRLVQCDIDKIASWIDAGLPNN